MRLTIQPTRWLTLAICLATAPLFGVTLEELRSDAKLTPESFARHFSNFKYERHDEVQPCEIFLETRAGDCDDFATLASMILREKGFTTRLISVRLPEDTHVVCYIEERKSYLDFNNRGCLLKTVSSTDKIEDIARRVAKSFDSRWVSACEFDYRDGLKWLIKTATPAGPTGLVAALSFQR